MMKKQWIVPCLLIFALLLSACAGQGAAAGTSAPESDAAGAPSSAAAEPALPAPALSGPDSPGNAPEEDAAEPEPAVHTLTEEEMAALWQQLDGAWRVNDPGSYDGGEPMCLFTRVDGGEFVLVDAIVASEGVYQYIHEAAEQNGAYQLIIDRTGGVMSVSEYEPDARSVLTLVLREDGTIEISTCSPARYGQMFEDTSEFEMGIMTIRYRCATAEEEEMLKNSAEGYLWLENGDILSQSYDSGPMQFHRETPEEEHARIG